MSATEQETSQQRFDRLYISGTEICTRLQINRTSLSYARARGYLPDPVEINNNQITLWERNVIEPYLCKWESELSQRKERKQLFQQKLAQAADT